MNALRLFGVGVEKVPAVEITNWRQVGSGLECMFVPKDVQAANRQLGLAACGSSNDGDVREATEEACRSDEVRRYQELARQERECWDRLRVVRQAIEDATEDLAAELLSAPVGARLEGKKGRLQAEADELVLTLNAMRRALPQAREAAARVLTEALQPVRQRLALEAADRQDEAKRRLEEAAGPFVLAFVKATVEFANLTGLTGCEGLVSAALADADRTRPQY